MLGLVILFTKVKNEDTGSNETQISNLDDQCENQANLSMDEVASFHYQDQLPVNSSKLKAHDHWENLTKVLRKFSKRKITISERFRSVGSEIKI